MEITRLSKQEAQEYLDVFTTRVQTLNMATTDANAAPFASYSPFVEDEQGNYYVFLSDFVRHASNIKQKPDVHILFIEDESTAATPFGRQRLYFDAQAKKVEKNSDEDSKVRQMFLDKFGDNAEFVKKQDDELVGMHDFNAYKLTPIKGGIVLGFGAAFSVTPDKKIIAAKTMGKK